LSNRHMVLAMTTDCSSKSWFRSPSYFRDIARRTLCIDSHGTTSISDNRPKPIAWAFCDSIRYICFVIWLFFLIRFFTTKITHKIWDLTNNTVPSFLGLHMYQSSVVDSSIACSASENKRD